MVNRGRGRVSHHIQGKPAGNLHHGVRIAEKIGLPLTLLVSINYALTNCDDAMVSESFKKTRDAFGKWVTRPKLMYKESKAAPAYVRVIENPASGQINVYWLMHVPVNRQEEFKEKLAAWINRHTGALTIIMQSISKRPGTQKGR
jgi:dsDNA-binding SOS-regulon protein